MIQLSFVKRLLKTFSVLLIVLPLVAAGCGGSDDSKPATQAATPGIYVGDTRIATSLASYTGTYASGAEVREDGRVRLFGVDPTVQGESSFRLLSFGITTEPIEGRNAEALLGNVVRFIGIGTSRQTSAGAATFDLEAKDLTFVAKTQHRSLPTLGTTYRLTDGTYTGRVFFLDQQGHLDAFGPVEGNVSGTKLTAKLVFSGRPQSVSGDLSLDLVADGATKNQVLNYGATIRLAGITYSSDGSQIVLRLPKDEGTTDAWIVLSRR